MVEEHSLSPLAAIERAPVEALLDLCFGIDRQQRTASLLRRGASRIDDASFAALRDGVLLGSVECWTVSWNLGDDHRPLVLLGPLAIEPGMQGMGIGRSLMGRALAAIDRRALPVMLIGDPPYYNRFGFFDRGTAAWVLPGPVERHRLLLRAEDPDRYAGPAVIRAPKGAAIGMAA